MVSRASLKCNWSVARYRSGRRCATLELHRPRRRPEETTVLERQLYIPADPSRLWEALTEPRPVSEWFGARVEWDLTPGGAARFVEDDGAVREGRVDAVSPGRRLRFRWWPEGQADQAASEVTYTLDPEDDGTR